MDGLANSSIGKDSSPLPAVGSVLGSWVMCMMLGTIMTIAASPLSDSLDTFFLNTHCMLSTVLDIEIKFLASWH